ncbi:DUF4215 domain-containing protein [Sorangium sp. So ce726]
MRTGRRERRRRRSVCGDSIEAGSAECDDGNTADGDGCSSTCHDESD